jgi:aspartate aminotransferase
MKLARRVASIQPSPTLAITSKAKAMKAEGIDVVGFGAGEPDFDTPAHIKAVAKKALDDGYTKYTPVPGSPQLKDAIIAKFQRDNGLEYQRENIIVSVGAKHSIYNVGQALFEEGDEIIIPAPYWVSYPDIALLAGATPVIVDTKEETGFKLSPEQLERAITPRTKCVILNSPSNPTGAAYTGEELKRIADVIVRRDVTVLSDDIYEKIVYDNFRFESIASFGEEIRKRTIVVNGLSKAYSMTGWRIGYLAADRDLVAAINNIQSQSTSNPVSFCDKAAIEALNGPQDFLKEGSTRSPASPASCRRGRSTSSRTSRGCTGRRPRRARRSTGPRASRPICWRTTRLRPFPGWHSGRTTTRGCRTRRR